MNDSGAAIASLPKGTLRCPQCGTKIDKTAFRIEKPTLLIVEGKDEEEFFSALIAHFDLGDIQVAGIGGKQQVKPRLKALVKDPGFSKIRSLGVIRDADESAKSAFQSVRDALIAARLPSPRRPLQPVKGPPRVNVMILPGMAMAGALEDVCLDGVAEDPAMGCVDEFFDCIRGRNLALPGEISKARLRVFLASREDPNLPLGLAAQRGYWPLANEAFEPLREFLRSL